MRTRSGDMWKLRGYSVWVGMLLSTIALSHSANVFAAPVVWNVGPGANGHAYEFVAASAVTWEAARDAAAAASFGGASGYLATITTAEENTFVAALINLPGITEAWIGAYQPNPADPPATGWVWITGEPFVYTNWDVDEPNDNLGDEHFLGMWGSTGFGGPLGTWNDQEYISFGGNISGYVVEYPVPVPGTVWLLASAIGLLRMVRSKMLN